ncbi:hypothetical protein BMR04_16650 [Methylococcaceae bacterium HT3]|nr:hypothetical protein BMR04_16650 [Methylococcaceae bacterium HT3]
MKLFTVLAMSWVYGLKLLAIKPDISSFRFRNKLRTFKVWGLKAKKNPSIFKCLGFLPLIKVVYECDEHSPQLESKK